MRDRILLVGEDFGNSPVELHSDKYALSGQSGQRLAALAGLAFPSQYCKVFERTNVVELIEHWDDKAIVMNGAAQVQKRMRGRRTILLGVRVAAALGVARQPVLTWAPFGEDGWVGRFPHPSGRSRWWNDPTQVTRAEAFVRAALSR